MKEIIAVIRMNKTGATKKALVEAGVAGFTALKVMGRGKLVEDPSVIADRKQKLLAMAGDEADGEAERVVEEFLDGTSLFPRRMFTILSHDDDVEKVIKAVMQVNRTDNRVGDGKIFIMPVDDAVRVRTGETGEAAV
ncbi:MAG TPA: P-II family nitrogen regulator [Patescibacteria group bacterium]|nr:P-II family nitrogen regulator [Patescibacteria group bacterium]